LGILGSPTAGYTGSLLQQADVDALMTVPVGGVPP
jgi:hypothetical protein